MYSIDCKYYNKSFNYINDLIDDIIESGQDPNYDITFNGQTTGEMVIDLIEF